VEPVRIKMYGLFSLTKQRYLSQAIAGVLGAVVILVGWYFIWPPMRDRLARPDLPPSSFREMIVAILGNVPWILLAALAYKAMEVYIVLRIFGRKEANAVPARKGEPGAPAPG
jgi:hypothetical protein